MGALPIPKFQIKRGNKLMTREKNTFFLVLVIVQKLINYIIIALRKLLLFVMLVFMNLNLGHETMMLLKKYSSRFR